MLTIVYRVGQCFVSRGWILGLVLIVLTLWLGTAGFLATRWEDGTRLTWADALYNSLGLLAIQSGSVPTTGNWSLEAARWLGLIVWASAIVTVLVQLFREAVHRKLVKLLARDHLIIAGLGHHGGKLVESLRKRGRTVVVLESDPHHSAIEQCRRAGAVVLVGEPDDENMLRAANLSSAAVLLALFPPEQERIRIATAAFHLLRSARARKAAPVRCVLRLIEPGLLDVVRRHKIKTDLTDRIQLEILNSHEIAATTMVREAATNLRGRPLQRLLVLGLGTYHRLGEMVILRAAKDHLIARNGRPGEKLEIQVFDKHADDWIESFRSRYPFVDDVCSIAPHRCWARKAGPLEFPRDAFDAAFVCIPDEGVATAQAVMLRQEVLTQGQPIIVRVLHTRTGYGELLCNSQSSWGENLIAVGLEDSLLDPEMVTQPEMEMRAQAIHHEYRARCKDFDEPANRPWLDLDETFREANRQAAARYALHLAYTDGRAKTKRYRMVFRPEAFTRINLEAAMLFRFASNELEVLAANEHRLWKDERERAGWKYGPEKCSVKKTNPLLVPYAQLTDESVRELNRAFIRSLPNILALADYTILPEDALSGLNSLPEEYRSRNRES